MPSSAAADDKEYTVEKILDWKTVGGKDKFLIKWKGYPKPTWEPASNLNDSAREEALDLKDRKRAETAAKRKAAPKRSNNNKKKRGLSKEDKKATGTTTKRRKVDNQTKCSDPGEKSQSAEDDKVSPKKVDRKKYRYECSAEGCTNHVQKRGVCVRHGAKVKRCSSEGCTKQAKQGGVCRRHGAKVEHKRCSSKGCTNIAQRGGVCKRHGAKVEHKRCSTEGCTNQAQKGGVCIRHGAKKGGKRAHQNPNEREDNSLNELNAAEANAVKTTLRDKRENLEIQRESASPGEADSDEASTAVEIVGKEKETRRKPLSEAETEDRVVVKEEEPLPVDPSADVVMDGLAEREYLEHPIRLKEDGLPLEAQIETRSEEAYNTLCLETGAVEGTLKDVQEVEKRLQSEIERYKKENNSLKEENDAVKARLMDTQEDLDIQHDTTNQMLVTLGWWHRRFDKVSALAEAAGVDAAVLKSIRDETTDGR
jgi:hypothetical protein